MVDTLGCLGFASAKTVTEHLQPREDHATYAPEFRNKVNSDSSGDVKTGLQPHNPGCSYEIRQNEFEGKGELPNGPTLERIKA